MKNLVIDTDIGTDTDDIFALAYAIKNPNAEVKAVTTVHGDTRIRAKIVKKLERILGVDIPVFAGAAKPLQETEESRTKCWCGFEHLALDEKELKEEFDLYLRNSSIKYGKYDGLVCIGPLTNIALQLEDNSSHIKNIENIYMMGSSLESHNLAVDPKAAELVLNQKWNIYQITKPVSLKVNFTKEELKDLRVNELGDFLYNSAIRWLNFSGKEKAVMYDVLAVSAAIGEKFVKFKEEENKLVSYDVDLEIKDKIMEVIKNA